MMNYMKKLKDMNNPYLYFLKGDYMQFIENIEKKGTQTTIDDLIEIENKIDVLMEYLLGFTMTNEYDVVFTVTENHIEFDICLEDSGYDEKNYFFEIISNIFEKNNRTQWKYFTSHDDNI